MGQGNSADSSQMTFSGFSNRWKEKIFQHQCGIQGKVSPLPNQRWGRYDEKKGKGERMLGKLKPQMPLQNLNAA